MSVVARPGESYPVLVEIFDCGHGHKSEHHHETCQIPGCPKPGRCLEHWSMDIEDGKTVMRKL